MRRLTVLALTGALLLAAGCGDEDDGGESGASASAGTTTTRTATNGEVVVVGVHEDDPNVATATTTLQAGPPEKTSTNDLPSFAITTPKTTAEPDKGDGRTQKTTILARGQLEPPDGTDSKAVGIALVVRQGGETGLYVQAEGLKPTSDDVAYAVWLRGDSTQFLGFIQTPVSKEGVLQSISALEVSIDGYDELLLTRETRENPDQPGTIALKGKLTRPSAEEQDAVDDGMESEP